MLGTRMHQPHDQDQKIDLVTTILLVGFSVSVLFHYINGAYFGFGYPQNTFLFSPRNAFRDFFVLYEANSDLNPYFGPDPSAQFPFLNLLAFLFSLIPRSISFACYTLLVIEGFVWVNALHLRTNSRFIYSIRVFVFSFLSYPLLFTLDRGNFEGLLCVFLLFFIVSYQKQRFMLAAVFLALAIAMKVFPVVFLVLLVADRKYKESLLTIVLVIAITLASLFAFKGGFVNNTLFILQGSNFALSDTWATYAGNNHIVQRGVTLLTFFKVVTIETGLIAVADMVSFLNSYTKVMVVLFGAVAAYVVLVEKEAWKKTAMLVFSMLLFPQVSADYKLLHVFLPLLVFIRSAPKGRSDLFYAAMFAALLIPKDYYYLPHVISDAVAFDISIAVLLNPLIMVITMGAIAWSGLRQADRVTVRRTLLEHADAIRVQWSDVRNLLRRNRLGDPGTSANR